MATDKRIPAARIRDVWMDQTISGDEAARIVGLSRVNLWRRAKAMGLPQRRQCGQPRAMPPDAFRALWCAGVRASDIATYFGCGKSTVGNTARRMGLPGRNGLRGIITLVQFREEQLARRMAASARQTRDALVLAEMVDGNEQRRVLARRAA